MFARAPQGARCVYEVPIMRIALSLLALGLLLSGCSQSRTRVPPGDAATPLASDSPEPATTAWVGDPALATVRGADSVGRSRGAASRWSRFRWQARGDRLGSGGALRPPALAQVRWAAPRAP